MSSCVLKPTIFRWTREMTKDLISLYEGQPVLYLTRLKEYKNKNKRADAIEYIRRQLQDKYSLSCAKLTDNDVNKKIHTIRTQYLKEVGILKKFLSSGAPADAYKPKLWCFDILQFLTEGDSVRESQSNLEVTQTAEIDFEEDGEEDDEVIFEGTTEELTDFEVPVGSRESTPTSGTHTPNQRKRPFNISSNSNNTSVAALINTAVNSLEDHRKNKKTETEDEFDVFGRIVSTELRKFKDKKQICKLKQDIFNTIMNAQLEEY